MAERPLLPLRELYDDHAPGTLTWLQAWSGTQCNGDWEHRYGITIETLDNPGWRIQIELTETLLGERPLQRREAHRSKHDWFVAWVADGCFHAACGPLNLGEALHEFRLYADGPPELVS